MPKALSPLIGTVLLIAFTIGVAGIVNIFLTTTAKTSTGITSNASESLFQCSAAAIDVPKDSIYCISGYNLTLLLHFDEGSGTTASDSSGNGRNGVLTNFNFNSLSGWTTGKFSNALMFDGSNDYVNITDDGSLSLDRVSVEVWFNRRGPGPGGWDGSIVSKEAPAVGSGKYNYYIRTSANNNYKIDFNVHNSSGDACTLFSKVVAETGKWYHVVGTSDGTSFKLYINGEVQTEFDQIATCVPTTLAKDTSKSLLIGNGATFYFNGTIDEVRIYNRALSAAEVKQQYQSGITELFGNKSYAKFQLQNNGQFNLRKAFNFVLSTSSASNVSAINLNNDLAPASSQLVALRNLTLSTLGVGSVQGMHISSSTCPNVQLDIKDLGMDC